MHKLTILAACNEADIFSIGSYAFEPRIRFYLEYSDVIYHNPGQTNEFYRDNYLIT